MQQRTVRLYSGTFEWGKGDEAFLRQNSDGV